MTLSTYPSSGSRMIKCTFFFSFLVMFAGETFKGRVKQEATIKTEK